MNKEKNQRFFSSSIFSKSRKGDIPITILVIGVLAVCIIAIFTFYFSSRAMANNFDSIGIVEKAAVMKEEITFYKTLGFSENEITQIFGINADALGKYFVVTKGSVSVRYNLGK